MIKLDETAQEGYSSSFFSTMLTHNSQRCLVSSCLLGLCTRYDGQSKPDSRCLTLLQNLHYIPVCPEQLGGLATPRVPANLTGSGEQVLAGCATVITQEGTDVSQQFIAGAKAVLQIAQMQKIQLALLKAKSPSCGLKPQVGVTAALLLQHGIQVIEF
ncbi:DUF523 domain-containing protein [Candidatus Electronema sp. PJ]|uniref:DUF523 domain-containing protein n=1 Tax=Candidatus Electronema sp. PJ TaxID=3401572 RepID=UPI003AA7E9B0